MIEIPEYLERRRAEGPERQPERPPVGPPAGAAGGRTRPKERTRPKGRLADRRPGVRRSAGARLRVLLAPDSFKGSLTSVEVARALAEGWARGPPRRRADPGAAGGRRRRDAGRHGREWRLGVAGVPGPRRAGPAADGALAALGGRRRGPPWSWPRRRGCRGCPRTSPALRSRPRPKERARSCGRSSTQGVRHVVMGVGGSATTDGGAGLLRALGAGTRSGCPRLAARSRAGPGVRGSGRPGPAPGRVGAARGLRRHESAAGRERLGRGLLAAEGRLAGGRGARSRPG